jgi:hypothetical protein
VRTTVGLSEKSNGYQLRLTGPQRQLVRSVLEVMQLLNSPEEAIVVQTGRSRADLESFSDRFSESTVEALTADDLHVLHAVLTVVGHQFPPSEEAFYIRVGFFREHVAGLASSLVEQIAKLG